MHTSVEHRSDPRFTAGEHELHRGSAPHDAGIPGPLEQHVRGGGDGWRMVDVFLTGGAPWGFSLKGGLEYNEPLIISKVEEGSQAWAVRLQVGDEVLEVNELPLSGYRQEAIGLVKGSHRSLALGVRRRTEAVNRPHYWPTVEPHTEAWRRQTADTVSQRQYDASVPSDDLSRGWDHSPHPCSMEPAPGGGGAEYRDSAYSSFATRSGTPELTLEGAWYSLGPDEKQGAGHAGGRDGSRRSASPARGRADFGPVWHVPEKSRAAPSSPPPLALPVHGDDFAVTMALGKGPVARYSDGPGRSRAQSPPRQYRGVVGAPDGLARGRQAADRGPGIQRSYDSTFGNKEPHHPHSSAHGGQPSSRSGVEFPSGHAPRQQQQYREEGVPYPQPPATAPAVPGPAHAGGYSYSPREPPAGHAHARTSAGPGALHPDPDAGSAGLQLSERTVGMGGGGGVEAIQGAKEMNRNSKSHKAKHRLPQLPPQRHSPVDQDSSCYGKHKSPPHSAKPNGSERRSQGRDNGYQAESHYVNYSLGGHEKEEWQASQGREESQEVWQSQHGRGPEAGGPQEPCPSGPQPGEQGTGSERFATILRNEIQQRRAQLQKSRSAAALEGSGQAEEEEDQPAASAETPASSSDGSLSSTYKDHLKEVQTRVLQATSFRRRDLEPESPPSASAPPVALRPEAPPPAVLSRIRGRKSFPPEQTVRSVSEPNKMHEVGVEGAEPESGPSCAPDPVGPLADRRRVFELTGKPVFQKPFLKQASGGRTEGGVGGGVNSRRSCPEGQQPCTFAEYEPTWDVRWKPPEAKAAGRCHSADNILDPSMEEWSRTSYLQERPRSGDLYGQNHDSGWKSAEFSHPEHEPARRTSSTPRVNEHTHGALEERRSLPQPDRFSEPPPEGAPQNTPLPPDQGHPHRYSNIPLPPDQEHPHRYSNMPLPPDQGHSHGPAPGEAGVAALRTPRRPKPERRPRSEGVPHAPSQRQPPAYPPPPYSPSSDPPAPHWPPAKEPHPQRPVGHHAPCSSRIESENNSRTLGKFPEAPPPQPGSANGLSSEVERERAELGERIRKRTSGHLMEDLLPQEGVLLGEAQERREEDGMAAAVALVTGSSYCTHAGEAELLRRMQALPGFHWEGGPGLELAHRKQQLIDRLGRKLQVLREVRESLLEEVRSNEALGEDVEAGVEQVCRPNELEKFRMFVGDLDTVLSLLLSLSARLARVENALSSLQEHCPPEERRSLTQKQQLLLRQHQDALELQENLRRRQQAVSLILTGRLSAQQLRPFRRYVRMKAALLVERRRLDDRIKLGEEQLKCLTDSLLADRRPSL